MTGLSARTPSLVAITLTSLWSLSNDDEAMGSAEQGLIHGVGGLSGKTGLDHPFEYLDYAASRQDPSEGPGPKHCELCKAVVGDYDPEQIFEKRFPGGLRTVLWILFVPVPATPSSSPLLEQVRTIALR